MTDFGAWGTWPEGACKASPPATLLQKVLRMFAGGFWVDSRNYTLAGGGPNVDYFSDSVNGAKYTAPAGANRVVEPTPDALLNNALSAYFDPSRVCYYTTDKPKSAYNFLHSGPCTFFQVKVLLDGFNRTYAMTVGGATGTGANIVAYPSGPVVNTCYLYEAGGPNAYVFGNVAGVPAGGIAVAEWIRHSVAFTPNINASLNGAAAVGTNYIAAPVATDSTYDFRLGGSFSGYQPNGRIALTAGAPDFFTDGQIALVNEYLLQEFGLVA